ncbi:MAG TPA: DNA mismatch repair protein MutS [Candidatus Nitrosotenuis sp.]|nr:DNA mismatch repair protein MutS [Candidatus Nitrosotenuis sp.]
MTDQDVLTPLFQQYFKLKEANPGCLLLMQVGDFYEAYGEDAERLAADVEIALTSKEAGGGRRVAMAGVPMAAVEPYLRTLVGLGRRVALADQVEDPRQARGLVRREVVRVVTSGTVLDQGLLDEKSHNFLVCLAPWGEEVGLAAADVTTGHFVCTEVPAEAERLWEEAGRFSPSEILVAGEPRRRDLARQVAERLGAPWSEADESPDPAAAAQILGRQFRLGSLLAWDLEGRPAALTAAGALVRYLQMTGRRQGLTLDPPRGYSSSGHMVLDATSRRNLELTETLLGRQRKGSLLGTPDCTCTSMGARVLRQWLLRPLLERQAIEERHQAVAVLVECYAATLEIREALRRVLDVERLLARVLYGSAGARDLVALRQSLQQLPPLAERLRALASAPRPGLLADLAGRLDLHLELRERLEQALTDDPPAGLKEGGLLRDGFSAELDELRAGRAQGREWIASLEERERAATGIKSLKVGFNQVFGYYLEVTRANLGLVPDHYQRRQTLANAERYITPELKEYEARVLGAEERIRDLEYELFCRLRQEVAAAAEPLRRTFRALAELDVLACLAENAVRWNWVRPEMVDENVIELRGARHPVVERALAGGFVPNDCHLDPSRRLIILTGPNMSGKSTYLRQTALCVLLAQMGSFVPARSARLGITDRIFTRVGASDDLHLGQSTFMVEMAETANILRQATPRSLVVLDEIGRGTSTFDGLALARAVAEHLHDEVGARTLFATHFHEMTRLERTLRACRNYRVAVQEAGEEVVFLHRIVPGGADRSYGIHVARLAGIPAPVIERARALLRSLESEGRRRTREREPAPVQLDLFAGNGPPAGP